ncbi:MAG: Gfo/Idh/MocA family protein [Flavobacteriales bacterium]
MNTIRVAVIGGGALAENLYLPLLKQSTHFSMGALVEPNHERGKKMAQAFNIPQTVASHTEIADDIDAVIITSPNSFHNDQAQWCLRHQKHVLIEKPVTISVAQSQELIHIANQVNKIAAVGHVRRFFSPYQQTKRLIESKKIGKVTSFEITEGFVFNWPLASPSLIHPAVSGGGILMDVGPHVLDLLIHWFGMPLETTYYDDFKGGVEAECMIKLKFPDQIHGTIHLSRLRNLNNQWKLIFEKNTLTFEPKAGSELQFEHPAEDLLKRAGYTTGTMAFTAQLDNFYRAIQGIEKPECTVQEGAACIRVIENCYTNRKPVEELYTHY